MRDFRLFIDSIKSGSDCKIYEFKTEFLEMQDEMSWRILHYACFYGRVELVNLLISEKCKIDPQTREGYQPIHLACMKGHIDIVKILITCKCDINTSDYEGYQPIHLAFINCHIGIVKILIANNCDIYAYDKEGYQVIHWACWQGHTDIVKILIDNNCDINTYDKSGYQGVHWACHKGHIDIVKLLIANNCETRSLTTNGKSPIRISEQQGHEKIVNFLNKITSIIEAVDNHFQISSGHITFRQSLESETLKNCTEIGSGSFGNVYKYKISNTKYEIAIKITNSNCEDKKNIEENLDKYSPRIYHRNIVRYFGALMESQKLHIYMEYIPGGSLNELIDKLKNKKEFIENPKVIKFTKQILEGLKFLHSQGIIHRDIKPDNMLLDQYETLKLADFGISKSLRIESFSNATDKAKTFCGTPNYLAPEVIVNNLYDFSADIWSTGASIIHMIIGEMRYRSVDATVSKKSVTFSIGLTKLKFRTNYIISEEMLSFIDYLLTPEQSIRPSAESLLNNSIFKDIN